MALLPLLDDLLDEETDRELAFGTRRPDRGTDKEQRACHATADTAQTTSPSARWPRETCTPWWPSTPPARAARGAPTSSAGWPPRCREPDTARAVRRRRRPGPGRLHPGARAGRRVRPQRSPALRLEVVGVRADRRRPRRRPAPVRRAGDLGATPRHGRDAHRGAAGAHRHAAWFDALGFELAPDHDRRLRRGRRRRARRDAGRRRRHPLPDADGQAHEIDYGAPEANDHERLGARPRRRALDDAGRPDADRAHRPRHHRPPPRRLHRRAGWARRWPTRRCASRSPRAATTRSSAT